MEQILLEVCLWHLEDREVVQDTSISLTKGMSCLTNPVAFCGGETTSEDSGKATYILVYLDSHKAFTMVPHLDRREMDSEGVLLDG